jgi:hypothetical protein
MGPSDNSSVDKQFKEICAGIGCRHRPSVSLHIIIVDKTGSFCKSCGDDLIRLGIAEPLDGGCESHHDETDDCHSAGGR